MIKTIIVGMMYIMIVALISSIGNAKDNLISERNRTQKKKNA